MSEHEVVQHDEWVEARTALPAKEKEFTRLRAYCGWRTGSASDAQDAVEVFLTAWRRLDDLPYGMSRACEND